LGLWLCAVRHFLRHFPKTLERYLSSVMRWPLAAAALDGRFFHE
jgi:hypothetical protein